MKRIGITGGIATGKSTVTNYLRQRGYSVIDADVGARAVVAPGTIGLKKVVDAFGSNILEKDGTINRQQLGSIIFNDASKRQQLNQLLHPLIFEWIEEQVEQLDHTVIFIDMPLLYEVGYQQRVDEVWLVDASSEVQLKRLMTRNQLTRAEAKERIDAQWPLEKKRQLADEMINNDSTLEELYQKINYLLKKRH